MSGFFAGTSRQDFTGRCDTTLLRKSPQALLCMMAKWRRQVVVNREIYLPSPSLHEEQRGESSKKSCLTHQLLIRPPFCSSIRNGIITNGGQVAFLTSKWVESPSSSGPQVANVFPMNAGVGLRGRETLIRACYCVSDGGKVMLILCHNGARGDKGK